MRNIKVSPLQCLGDVCVEFTGVVDTLFDTAQVNGNISITDDLRPGQPLLVDTDAQSVDKRTVSYFESNEIKIGTVGKVDIETGLNYDNLEYPGEPFTIQ